MKLMAVLTIVSVLGFSSCSHFKKSCDRKQKACCSKECKLKKKKGCGMKGGKSCAHKKKGEDKK